MSKIFHAWAMRLTIMVACATMSLPAAASNGTAEDHNLPATFQKVLDDVKHPENWEEVPIEASWNIEEFLMMRMGEIIRKMQLEPDYRNQHAQTADKPKPWLKDFLPRLYQSLSDDVNRKNEQWYQEYMELVQNYNQATMNVKQFESLRANLMISLKNLNELRLRIKSVRDVHLQQLQGVPTTFLVFGTRTWDHLKESRGKSYNIIQEGVKSFAAKRFIDQNSFVFSDLTVKDSRVVSETIQMYGAGEIEAYETDPHVFYKHTRTFVVHRYRCYPQFNSTESGGPTVPSPPEAKNTEYSIVDHRNVDKIFVQWDIGEKDQEKINELLDRTENNNLSAVGSIRKLDEEYIARMHTIETLLDKTGDDILSALDELCAGIGEIFGDFDDSELKKQIESYLRQQDAVSADGNHDRLDRILSRIRTKYDEEAIKAEEDFQNKLARRTKTIFTLRQGFMGDDQQFSELTQKLLEGSFDTIMLRKNNLMRYEITVVENKKLVNHKAEEYYKEGKIRRYYMFPPVLTFEGSISKLSCFLALQVEFSRDETSSSGLPKPAFQTAQTGSLPPVQETGPSVTPPPLPPQVEAPPDPRIMDDSDSGLQWLVYLENDELGCFSFEDAVGHIRSKGFSMPSMSQLKLIQNRLQSSHAKANMPQAFRKFLAPDGPSLLVWSDSPPDIYGNRKLLNFKTGEETDKVYDYCGYVLGVTSAR